MSAQLPAESGLAPLSPEELLHLYREMALIRRVEELAAKAYSMKKILGFCHLYIGQEALAVGTAAVTGDDYWMSAYREHGQALAKGMSARSVMAELFGRSTGCSRGLGGSMHMFDKDVRFLGGYGIVGAHVPLANGVAWAAKQRGEGRMAVVFFGDGAANQGAFFEALCLAQLYKLPVMFICENNGYAMGTAVERSSALTDLSRRGDGVGMVRHHFEAFDVEVVREEIGRAARFIREGNGPVILDLKTYRYRGHSMSDPAKYRSREELDFHRKQKDALAITRHRLEVELGMDPERFETLHQEVDAVAQDAWDFADSSPEPELADLYQAVYAD